MIFSQRYLKAIEDGRLVVDLPQTARAKLWKAMVNFNRPFSVQRDPNDNWHDNTSAIDEAKWDLLSDYGLDVFPWDSQPSLPAFDSMRQLVLSAGGHHVLDAIEVETSYLGDEKEAFRSKVNEILDSHECPWRISDGEFFKLDADFMGARLAARAHDALAANHFAGAADEYAKARRDLAEGETKDAILHAGKSFESVLKVLTENAHGNADRLIKEFVAKGFLDDLPEDMRVGFGEQVLKTLPTLRNKLAGHGQGAEIVTVDAAYGELAVQLAAAFHNFLITKHLARKPPEKPPAEPPAPAHERSPWDSDIPF